MRDLYDEDLRDANQTENLYIMKRSGKRVPFDQQKIIQAIRKANGDMSIPSDTLPEKDIQEIALGIKKSAGRAGRDFSVEEIQDMVENAIMSKEKYNLARAYITYRYVHNERRNGNTLDKRIIAILENDSEDAKEENSNKNPTVLSVQRDYMAGEWSRHYTEEYLLPKDIMEAHREGIIHFHDSDYFAQHEGNCCLINLEDMLENGTKLSDTPIYRPRSFATACTLTSQIVSSVASSQYGGQTITLSHLAPFVDVSRQKIRTRLIKEFAEEGISADLDKIDHITERELRKEVEAGCQTIQYQLITLQTTNGQAPFVTVFMYLNEVPEGQLRDDLALIIEVMLKQREAGIQTGNGIALTPAFPKLIYVLQENNIDPGTPYYHLTELAAACTAKRMVPDYISEKIMMELKGDTYPCMGCVDKDEVITYKFHNTIYTESFHKMWNRLCEYYTVRLQDNRKDEYMDTPDVEIWDQKIGFVKNYRVVRNYSTEWMHLVFSNGRTLTCTTDHPFETENRGIVYARDLTENDTVKLDATSDFTTDHVCGWHMDPDRAWFYGFMLCDSTYYDHITASIAMEGEDDIENKLIHVLSTKFHLNAKVVKRKRGAKGFYKDIKVTSNEKDNRLVELKNRMIELYEGKRKADRHIPNEVFQWDAKARLSFLAGMIDADGYINSSSTITTVQIGSTNKELAIQQLLLAQTLHMPARIYKNHYRENCRDYIRYRVEFVPTEALLEAIVCEKKKNRNICLTRTNHSNRETDETHLISAETFTKDDYSYDVTTESEHFTVSGLYSHNCRSFLTPDRFTDAGIGNIAHAKNWERGKHKYYGRFNQGVVTINLVDVACSSKQDENKFWDILDERLELCHRALRIRHERLKGTLSDVAPIMWQDGALARLQPGETIDELLYHGYSTISLGYAGLAECVRYMCGCSHTSEKGKDFGLRVMQRLNDACYTWKTTEDIDYSLYGTPLESTTYKFAKCLQRRFGIIEDVTDKNYITNSYHIKVTEKIDAFSKLSKEAEFQKLSPGGAVSYVEVPDMHNNIPAVLAIMKHIYNTILYAELNTKIDYCENCGYEGEIKVVKDGSQLIWECPNCGCRDQSKMHVARRTCGQECPTLHE